MIECIEYITEMKNPIIPCTVFWQRNTFSILWVHPTYVIKEYSVIVRKKDLTLHKVFIHNAYHPNAGDPTSNAIPLTPPPKAEFCFPDWVKNIEVRTDDDYKFLEDRILNRWWLDDPHHYPDEGFHFVTDPPMRRSYINKGGVRYGRLRRSI